MITIDQLLESVDLDFEPRFVTKSRNGYVEIWSDEPTVGATTWYHSSDDTIYQSICRLKLAEFENKPWQECIYEVPRKTTGKIKHIERIDDSFVDKINAIIDAVNELKSRTENVQPPYVRLYTCSDGAVFDNEDIAKSHEINLKSKQSMN